MWKKQDVPDKNKQLIVSPVRVPDMLIKQTNPSIVPIQDDNFEWDAQTLSDALQTKSFKPPKLVCVHAHTHPAIGNPKLQCEFAFKDGTTQTFWMNSTLMYTVPAYSNMILQYMKLHQFVHDSN